MIVNDMTIPEIIEVTQVDREALPTPTCPLCHTVDDTVTSQALAEGATWRCRRCGQMWSAERLATAAAYARTQIAAPGQVM